MRDATRIHRDEVEHHGSGDALVVAAVLCAAIMVAVVALHGGPDLLGGRFDASVAFDNPAP